MSSRYVVPSARTARCHYHYGEGLRLERLLAWAVVASYDAEKQEMATRQEASMASRQEVSGDWKSRKLVESSSL